MRMEHYIGDLGETQALEPDSRRHKEGNAAKDLLDQLRRDVSVRDQRMAERMAERDAAACRGLGRQSLLADLPLFSSSATRSLSCVFLAQCWALRSTDRRTV